MIRNISYTEYHKIAEALAMKLDQDSEFMASYEYIYGIPRGGSHLAQELAKFFDLKIIDTNELEKIDVESCAPFNTLVVDDLIDSGKTITPFIERRYKCAVLFNKLKEATQDWKEYLTIGEDKLEKNWIRFWYEDKPEVDIEDSIIRILEFIGENPNREGLLETPKRVVKSWKELFSGYEKEKHLSKIIKTFKANNHDQMILCKNIEFMSFCEHHMIPFYGRAHIAYIPNPEGLIIGLSKLARILEVYTRRFQIQENIGHQVTKCLTDNLNPLGSACVIEAKHLCMCGRGVSKQHSTMVTSSLTGAFLEKPAARQELMDTINSSNGSF